MKYTAFLLLAFFVLSATANLNWVVAPEDPQTAVNLVTPKFKIFLDGVEQHNPDGKLAMKKDGYIYGLDDDGSYQNFFGQTLWAPENFNAVAAGDEFKVHWSPDNVKEYASDTATYTLVLEDDATYTINFVASDEIISSGQDNAEGDSAPAAVDCVGSWGAYGSCTNGEKSRIYGITTPASNGGTECDYADLQSSSTSCSGAIGDSCQAGNQCATTHCGDAGTCAALPVDVDCVETETIGDCVDGQQSVTYAIQTVASGDGTPCSSDTSQACTGADGADCTDDAHCINECVSDVCATPSDCQETETVGACANGLQDVTYSDQVLSLIQI